MKDHPIAEIFPLLSNHELKALAEDIKTNGLREPVVTYEGKILDGRNRYRACKLVSVEPQFKAFTGDSPCSFVISLNLKRRHLTPSQGATSVVDAEPWLDSERKKRMSAGGNKKEVGRQKIDMPLRDDFASSFGTNRQYVSDAKEIKQKAPEKFEKIRTGEKTIREVKREIRREEHKQRVKAAQLKASKSPAPTNEPPGLVLADPPWCYEHCEAPDREVENHYNTATLDEIFKHSPKTLSDCILLLWATAPKLDEALQVMKAWGFTYRSCTVWDKATIGMGYWFRIQHELLLVGIKGKPGCTPESERISSIIQSPRGKHSQKPECVYEWIERAFPLIPKLEMYCRSPRKGWSVWGNEC